MMVNVCKGLDLKHRALVVLATAVFLVSDPAAAEAPSYRYLEVAYGTANLEVGVAGLGSLKSDQDGYGLDGSFSFLDDRLWIFGSYNDSSGDVQGSGTDLDVETIRLGLGGIVRAGASATIDGSLIYRKDDLSALGLSDDVNAFGAAAGFRANVLPSLELFGRFGLLWGDDYDWAPLVDLGVVWNIGKHFGISAAYERFVADQRQGGDVIGDVELNQYQLGARVKF